MIIKCNDCGNQFDSNSFGVCPVCEASISAQNDTNSNNSNTTRYVSKKHDYTLIGERLRTTSAIIFVLTVIVAIIVGIIIGESDYRVPTEEYVQPIVSTLVSGSAIGLFILIISWIFDGISDILKK